MPAQKKRDVLFVTLKNMFFIIMSSIVIHAVMSLVGLFLDQVSIGVITLNLFSDIFASKMYPIIFSYGVLLLIIITLLQKIKELTDRLHNEEVKTQKYESEFVRLQDLSGLLLQSVSMHNNKIREWVIRRKECGQAPAIVEKASEKIADSLDLLSRAFFLLPYIKEGAVPVYAKHDDQINREKVHHIPLR